MNIDFDKLVIESSEFACDLDEAIMDAIYQGQLRHAQAIVDLQRNMRMACEQYMTSAGGKIDGL